MGEHEQGGMLRVVVILGIISIISFVVIAAVIGLKGTGTANRNGVLQEATKAANRRDIDFTLTGKNGQLTSLVSRPPSGDTIKSGYLADVASGNTHNGNFDISYAHPAYYPGDVTHGVYVELMLNGTALPFIYEKSASDYIEVGIDYDITNATPVTYGQAKSLNLDSQTDSSLWESGGFVSGLILGVRSDTYAFTQRGTVVLKGNMHGTLVFKAPKSTKGSSYEIFIKVNNTNYDTLKLSNLYITNATH